MKRFLKSKQTPTLFMQGTKCTLRPNIQVQYNGVLKHSSEFKGITWRASNPTELTSLSRNQILFYESKTKLKPDTIVSLISTGGYYKGIPTYIGQFMINAHLGNVIPVTNYASNVTPMPPYVPTAWRRKERKSFPLWNGMSIDCTKTIFSKRSLQCCFDGTGTVSYEIEADWDIKHKTPKDFAEAVKNILYSI